MPAAPGLPGVDRRTLVGLVLTGAAGAALRDGRLMRPFDEGPQMILDSTRRSLTTLGQTGYDQLGPRKVAIALRAAERAMAPALTDPGLRPAQMRDAKHLYAQLLTMSANADSDTGQAVEAIRTAEMASSLALEVGDAQTAGHAQVIVAGALSAGGAHRRAVEVARRARSYAGSTPAGVMALLAEADAASLLGQAHTVLDTVTAAEEAHALLADEMWGQPGYSFGTYHPALLKTFGAISLATVGLHAEAGPRFEEAAAAAGPAAGLRVVIWLWQARSALEAGDAGSAHRLAGLAVAQAESRPAAWVAEGVRDLSADAGGAFVDLVERVDGWGFTPPV
ncbi:hypothetical protein AB1484_29310 [Parafrankia sp. FMc6]|uniref:hypothetical protein n=1 Tax=Parafrankia soli TaxID=2599596 RepID=UPI0034D726B3